MYSTPKSTAQHTQRAIARMQASNDRLLVQLIAISPVAFMQAKIGDKAIIRRSTPKKNEYRDKIGTATEALLVFKNETKLGMIPRDFFQKIPSEQLKNVCRIEKMDRQLDVLVVELFTRDSKIA